MTLPEYSGSTGSCEDFITDRFSGERVTAVETNVLRLHGRLSREYGVSEIWGLVVVNEYDNHDRQHWILPWFMLVRIMYIMLNVVVCS